MQEMLYQNDIINYLDTMLTENKIVFLNNEATEELWSYHDNEKGISKLPRNFNFSPNLDRYSKLPISCHIIACPDRNSFFLIAEYSIEKERKSIILRALTNVIDYQLPEIGEEVQINRALQNEQDESLVMHA